MALSTTQYGYIIDPMVPFTDGKGKTIKDGFVRVFVAGSSTPVITYRNFDEATNQDRIELDNSGRTMTSVIGSKGFTYKVCVYDKHHSQESPILTVDKVSVIGANITAGTGATVVTGLDGLTTKPDGFVDASVVGTDGYVALDHTLVTDDLNTDAKVTAVENDRYIPLLNDDVNDPDSKMTLGRLWQWVLGHIKSIATSISTFRDGDYLFVDGSAGMAKMSKDDFLALIGNSQEIYQRLKEAMLRVDEIAGGIKPRIFGTNWFDQSNMLAGKWVSYENGTINDNPDYSCSQLTPIEESATYHAKNSVNGDQIAFYDINLDFIGGVLLSLQSDTEFHTPAGARFARYCTETANLTPFYIVKDSAIMWKDPYHFRGWYEGDEIIVAKDGSGYFTTLTEAASYAVDGDVIHVKAGVYDNEAVQLFGKTVTVYGDGCLNTIVKNGWNTYSKAPIEMTTGVLRDIQFYAYDGGAPSQDPSGATAYALHVDSDTSYGKPFLVERCIFISEKGNNAVGVGIYGGCDFIFRDCQFIGGVSTPFYVHDSTNTQYVGVMDLELYNNTFVSFGNGCFGIDAARLNGTTVYLTACGNNFHDNGTPVGLPHLFTSEVLYPPDNQPGPATGNTNIGVVNWNTKPLNNGNNLPIFNGGYQYATQGADWITHGQFGTDRIADGAITAAKVKDNETLPVNVSGKADSSYTLIGTNMVTGTNGYSLLATLEFSNINAVYAGAIFAVVSRGGGACFEGIVSVSLSEYSSAGNETAPIVGNVVVMNCRGVNLASITSKFDFYMLRIEAGKYQLYVHKNENGLPVSCTLLAATECTCRLFSSGAISNLPSAVATKKLDWICNKGVGTTSIPVYVDDNGQVQPCDLAQLKAALAAV